MATVYKRGDIWWARFFNADGKRVSASTGKTRKREAESEASRLEVEAKDPKGRDSGLPKAFSAIVEAAAREAASGDLTLARAEDLVMRLHRLANPSFRVVSLDQHLSAWVTTQEAHVEANTTRVYQDMHRRVIESLGPTISSAPVGDLTRKDVEKALAKIVQMKVRKSKTRTVRAATANMDLRALRRALESAVEAGLAKANVAKAIRPLPEADSTEKAPFTAEEVRRMIDHPKTNDQWKGAILIAAHSGLRMGDVFRLGSEHVEDTRLVIRPTKTKASKKTLVIPLSPPVIGWIGERKGPFFPDLSKLQKGTLSTTFTRIMKSAGVPREIVEAGDVVKRRSFHSLRHSFASWMAEADVHADVRQRLTGHSSAGIHQRYTHHDEALDRAVASLPAL